MAFTNMDPDVAEPIKNSQYKVWRRMPWEYFQKNFTTPSGANILRIRKTSAPTANMHVDLAGGKSSPNGGGRIFLDFSTNPWDVALDTRLSRVSPTVTRSPGADPDDDTADNAIDFVITLNGRTGNLVGTGTGSQTVFTATLTNLPLTKIRRAFIDLVRLTNFNHNTGTDVITANELTAGSINKSTGALSLTFGTAPANGAVIGIEFDGNVKKWFPDDGASLTLRRQVL